MRTVELECTKWPALVEGRFARPFFAARIRRCFTIEMQHFAGRGPRYSERFYCRSLDQCLVSTICPRHHVPQSHTTTAMATLLKTPAARRKACPKFSFLFVQIPCMLLPFCGETSFAGKTRNMSPPLYAARCSPAPAHTRLAPWIFMIDSQRLALGGGVNYSVVHINHVVTWTANQSGLVTLTLTFDLLTFWPWKWCPSHVWRGLPLSANFNLPMPLCSRLRPDVHDRKTDVRRQTA